MHMPAHERAEQHAERYGRRADRELQHLEPHDLVDQRGAAAADEEDEKQREIPGAKPAIAAGGLAGGLFMCLETQFGGSIVGG